jgi:MFS family permease
MAMASGLCFAAPPESEIYQRVMLTRDYWFLSRWHWYELIGLIAPVVILSVVAFGRRRDDDAARVGLARMAVAAGVTATVVALLFARAGMATHLVARMQPLRIFQLVYIVMTLVVGAAVGERVLQRRPWRWVVLFSLLAGVMVVAERSTFPASRHLELPGALVWSGSDGENRWEQAFVWIGRNTPKDALFALDAQYITKPGEDAESFRAIAERSALPDFSKDGGVVTNKPELAAEWLQGQVAQGKLSDESDALRVAALSPLGVTWVVLERGAVTGFSCLYSNEAVKVCRLP